MILTRALGFSSGAKLPTIIADIFDTGSPVAPTVVTGTPPVEVGQIQFSGTYSGQTTTSRYFQYGTTSSLGTTASIANNATTFTLSSIGDSATRHYRAVGENNIYTRTITGTVNPNFYDTTLSIVHGTHPQLVGATTDVVGEFTGSTPQPFTVTQTNRTANTNYYYKFVAVNNLNITVETQIYTYNSAAGVGYGDIVVATTAVAQPTPTVQWQSTGVAWDAGQAQDTQYRLRVQTVSGTTYTYSKWNGSTYVFQANLSSNVDGWHYSSFFWANTSPHTTTTTYYRITATDSYGRVKTVDKYVIAVRKNWGWATGTCGAPICEGSESLVNTFNSGTQIINEPNEDLSTKQAVLTGSSTLRNKVVNYKVTGAARNGVYNAFASYRRVRFYANGTWTGRQTAMENGTTSADSGWIAQSTSYSTGTFYYGTGDMPATSCGSGLYKYGTCSTGTEVEWGYNISNIVRATNVVVYVQYQSQSFGVTSVNSSPSADTAITGV